ncbi:MAG TPA: hypothetical protein DHW82_06830 [Spirochaetia bacterium]|nr:MAG: hypothetical protein A2Y41_00805 [Spirochaetes bacterium GWB1_36_13]HCL56709.1 hypothetical protein [Spirochaetia bacterium]
MTRFFTDFLRVLSILAVLVIHGSSPWEYSFLKSHQYFSEDFLGIILNQFARFAVPLFILLSGCSLTQKYQKEWGEKKISLKMIFRFYQSRALKILIPYLVLSFLFLLFSGRFSWEESFFQNLGKAFSLYGYHLLRGSAVYHFYFLVIITQFYLLFPFLYQIRKKFLLVIFLLIQIFLISPSQYFYAFFNLSMPSFHSAVFLYWAFYFYLGIILSLNIQVILEKIQKIPYFILSLFFLLSLSFVGIEYVFASYYDSIPDYYNHFHRFTILFYLLGFLAFALRHIQSFEKKITEKTKKLIARLSLLSFGVYLFHTLILDLLKQTIGSPEIFVIFILLSGISFGLIYLLDKWIKIKWIRTVLGL